MLSIHNFRLHEIILFFFWLILSYVSLPANTDKQLDNHHSASWLTLACLLAAKPKSYKQTAYRFCPFGVCVGVCIEVKVSRLVILVRYLLGNGNKKKKH